VFWVRMAHATCHLYQSPMARDLRSYQEFLLRGNRAVKNFIFMRTGILFIQAPNRVLLSFTPGMGKGLTQYSWAFNLDRSERLCPDPRHRPDGVVVWSRYHYRCHSKKRGTTTSRVRGKDIRPCRSSPLCHSIPLQGKLVYANRHAYDIWGASNESRPSSAGEMYSTSYIPDYREGLIREPDDAGFAEVLTVTGNRRAVHSALM